MIYAKKTLSFIFSRQLLYHTSKKFKLPSLWALNLSSTVPNVPVFQRALQYYDNIAVTDEHGDHTYGQLYERSSCLADLINSILGPEKVQERIAFLCPNDVTYVISQWATWMAGHIAVPLYPKHPCSQLEYFVRDSEASIIITTTEYSTKVKPVLSGQQVIVLEESLFKINSEDDKVLNVEKYRKLSQERQRNGTEEDIYSFQNAMILYTSGTTGPPKGVVLSHKNIMSQMTCLHRAWGWIASDVILHSLPLHHTHGIINALLCPLYIGARVVMLPEFNTGKVWSSLLALDSPTLSRINMYMAVPTMYAKLIEEYESKLIKNTRMREFVKAVCTQNIRLMVSGSAALPELLLHKWREITGHTLLERYGMTEIGMALSNPLNGERKPGFVGNPLPGVEVCVAQFEPGSLKYEVFCSSSNNQTFVTHGKKGEAGELLVRGNNVFKQYWKKPEATRKEFTDDGWFRTGDVAQYIDGAYKILGRSSVDIIKSGGFKISALEVERHLLSHPDIADVAVVGLPDITWGQKVAAVVVWKGKSSLDQSALRSWSKELLPHYQVPSVFKVIDSSLPRNNMGKVNKKQLVKDLFPDVSN